MQKNTQFIITKIQVSFFAEHKDHPSFAFILADFYVTRNCTIILTITPLYISA